MARWDEILSLPVQSPPTLEFSAADLVWSKIEGWRDNMDRLALIPFARVDDFVRGESANKDCPTRFHVEARRRRPPEASYKQKVDGILEYILYWCSFGPDDHRKGGVVRPSRNTYIPKKKKSAAGRPNNKRGCTCHFIVKRLIAEPSTALIIYNQDKHVDKKGLPCHGPQDKKAEGTHAMFAPCISEDLRLRVLSLLYVGVSVETIIQRHNELVEKQGGPTNRDDLLTHRYVRRQERNIRRSTYELDVDEAVSISMWVESHQSHVFFYEDFSDSDPFTLGIQTEWQLQQMIKFGKCSLLASDSRFGTSKLKYPVHSLVVFNSNNKAIPVAWIVTPRFASADPHKWMRALYNRVRAKDPTWKLAGFITDEPSMDIIAIRDVFQCSVLLSFWRVRHAWHKNLVNKCVGMERRVQVAKRLGELVDVIGRGHGSTDLFEAFMEDFSDTSNFTDYFKAVWYPRMGTWSSMLRTLPLASQESSAAMEFYHDQLKVRLMNEKDPDVYERADWLIYKLGTEVHSYFWLDEYPEKDYYTRYWKKEWVSGLTAWGKASKIRETDVSVEDGCAKVIDQIDRDRVHVVRNPGSQFSICDCSWAEMGNLCEHALKATRSYRAKGHAKPSLSLSQYKQALIDMLRCPRQDSFVRDYAVTLAVAVQKHLQSLKGLGSCQMSMDLVRRETLETRARVSDLSHQNRHMIAECQGIDEDVPSHNIDRIETQNAMKDSSNQENQLIDESRCMDVDVQCCGSDVLEARNAVSELSVQDRELKAEGRGTNKVILLRGREIKKRYERKRRSHGDRKLKDESTGENVSSHITCSLEHETAVTDSLNQVRDETRCMNGGVLNPCCRENDNAGRNEAPDVGGDFDENNKRGISQMDVGAVLACIRGSPSPAEEAMCSISPNEKKDQPAEQDDLSSKAEHAQERKSADGIGNEGVPSVTACIEHPSASTEVKATSSSVADRSQMPSTAEAASTTMENDLMEPENKKRKINHGPINTVSSANEINDIEMNKPDLLEPPADPASKQLPVSNAALESNSRGKIDYKVEPSVTACNERAGASTEAKATSSSMADGSEMPSPLETIPAARDNDPMEPENKKRKIDHGPINIVPISK